MGAGVPTATGLKFSVNVVEGRGYVVETSTNLVHWSPHSAFVSTAREWTLPDNMVAATRQRFYRILDRTGNLPPPPNDLFANSELLSGKNAVVSGYADGADTEIGEAGWGRSIWWSWTAPESGWYIVRTKSGQARVYRGQAVAALSLVASGNQPFYAQAGLTYHIRAESWGETAPVQFVLSTVPVVSVVSPQPSGVIPFGNATVFSILAHDDDTIKSIELVMNGTTTITASQHLLLTNSLPPGEYDCYVRAEDSFGVASTTNFAFRVAPENDAFADRIRIPGNTALASGSQLGAGKEPGEPVHGSQELGQSVWWSWVAPTNGFVAASLYRIAVSYEYYPWDELDVAIFTAGRPVLGVYSGDTRTLVGTNTSPLWGAAAAVGFAAVAGTEYHFAVDDVSATWGLVRLLIHGLRPSNDDFSQGIALTGFPMTTNAANVGATNENGEPFHAGEAPVRSLWWRWVAPSNGPVVITAQSHDVAAPVGNPRLAVYTGSSLSNLTPVVSAAASLEGGAAQVTFNAVTGVGYHIAVDDTDFEGDVRLTLGPAPATTLSSGQRLDHLYAPQGTLTYYKFTVAPGREWFRVTTFGGYGDCDVYVRHAAQPTFAEWDHRPLLDGNDEEVTVANPAAGEWHVMVHAYGPYLGVSLLLQ